MIYEAGSYDVAIIGAGHAGIEAALASARLGLKTIIFTINLDAIGNMPCNPNIGGTAKGHLVRELDALGGEMSKAADATFIQSRMLNLGKGPAVHSLRAQIDRRAYQIYMKKTLENEQNLDVKQAEIKQIIVEEDMVKAVVTHLGAKYFCKAVVIASGTYLNSRVIIGETTYESGPDGMFGAKGLSACLLDLGVELFRFKTGTPARINAKNVDISKMEKQSGDEIITPFSFETTKPLTNKIDCYLTYTNENTHKIIRDNLHRSPLYSGVIEGVGPRYCPSIEDKIVRFAEKTRHQLFVEPLGLETNEMYLSGMSSSLPEDVQIQMINSVSGLENAKIMRTAYAIEYDCVNSLQLKPTLEFKKISGLYGAGQFNGTSGYEEAAVQGFVAGVNAANKILCKPEFILDRSSSYIGTLIDDLVTKGTHEPYRMMTSRSEYRLILRQDNADERLTETGYSIGLISESRYAAFKAKKEQISKELERISKISVSPEKANPILEKYSSTPLVSGAKLTELIKRPELGYDALLPLDENRPELDRFVKEQVEIKLKYEGYIKRQLMQIAQFKKMEQKALPADIDYNNIKGLRIEARQKLTDIRPTNLGQASRISGVSPADISVLLIYLETYRGNGV